MTKHCRKCSRNLDVSEFNSDVSRPDKLSFYCKRCNKFFQMSMRYGLSRDDYHKMYEAQEGRCLWCKRTEEETGRSFHVDHCHKTGTVRRLLCSECNITEGNLAISMPWMLDVIEQLTQERFADGETG